MKIPNFLLRLGLATLTLCGLLASNAPAEQLAPAPINRGEWYVGAGAAYGRIQGAGFKSNEIFPIDPDVGCCLITSNDGYLITHDKTYSNDVLVPQIHFGYALKDPFGDGALRIEFSAEAYKRDESGYTAMASVPPDQFAVVIPIDGRDNPDGSLPDDLPDDDVNTVYGYAFGESFWRNDFKLSETSALGDVTVYFDTRPGKWRFTRGVGISYQYQRQTIWNSYYYDQFDLDSIASYDYLMQSHLFGGKMLYSAGYDIFKNTTLFTTGMVRLNARLTEFTGNQFAPGLNSFNDYSTPAAPRLWGSGSREYDFTDWGFYFKGRLGAGASVRLFFLRLTAHAEGNYVYGMPTPRDEDGKFEIKSGKGWGYLGTVTADVAF